ncbi:MAG: hypothetical protein IJ925_08340 [Muribaculaceae bacterium]|nr:hypothetical protein [Muribaculaceae bacterium]
MRRCILILSLLLTTAMLSWGQVSEPLVVLQQDSLQQPVDTVQQLSKIQKAKERFHQRIEAKLNEPYDTTRNKGYWWRALKHGKVNFKDSTMGYPSF